MKHSKVLAAIMSMTLLLSACGTAQSEPESNPSPVPNSPDTTEITEIILSDTGILVDGEQVGADPASAVYTANDIVYYESGKDFTYGEGTEADVHSADEAAAHTVVHITQPGTYRVSGTLGKGQIAVDLGKEAEEDPNAVVTLILNGVDITCEVAPAVIFYNVYECGSADEETAAKDVDTTAAGANVMIADGTTNTVNGSYVARIYKPDSVVLNKEGTEVEDARKLHKYDAAFYSKMSMNVNGGKEGTGVLHINAENEGLDSELHLTINGGTVIASGHMLDRIEDGGQTYAVFSFAQKQTGTDKVALKNESGEVIVELCPENDYSTLVYSGPDLTPGTYSLWSSEQQLVSRSGGMFGGMPGSGPAGMMPSGRPENMEQPGGEPPFEGMEPPQGEFPFDGMEPPEGEFVSGQQPPAEGSRPERPDGPGDAPRGPDFTGEAQELTADFRISHGANMFAGVSAMQ